jgi:hypothetical protein
VFVGHQEVYKVEVYARVRRAMQVAVGRLAVYAMSNRACFPEYGSAAAGSLPAKRTSNGSAPVVRLDSRAKSEVISDLCLSIKRKYRSGTARLILSAHH